MNPKYLVLAGAVGCAGVSFSHAADAVTNQADAISNVVVTTTTPVAAPGRAGGGFGGGNNAATEQDHQRMMDLLHITSIRRGRDGSNTNSPFYANYDESKANPFPNLPDPLILKNGEKVTTAEMWWKRAASGNRGGL